MQLNGQITFQTNNIPSNTNVISFVPHDGALPLRDREGHKLPDGDVRGFKSVLSFPYEGFFNKIQGGVRSLLNRQFGSETRNPDFNLLSANGTAPVTPTQGNGYEIVNKWFLGDDGGNAYTITPTPYANPSYAQTGSNYFLNLNVTNLTSALYLWNQNYSTTGQFNSMGKYNDQTLTFSTIIANNGANLPKVRFSAYMNDPNEDVPGGGVYLQPNSINLISTSLKIPDRKEVPYVNPFTQFRFNIEDLDSDTLDLDIMYLKCEISNFASLLNVDHIAEAIICNYLM